MQICRYGGAFLFTFVVFLFVVRIDMYVGGTEDLMGFILMFPFLSAEDKEKQRAFIVQKATSRYFPVYEKVRHRIPSFCCSGRAPVGTLGILQEAEEIGRFQPSTVNWTSYRH